MPNANTTTPGQSFPTPVGSGTPDITLDLYNLAVAIEKRVVGIYNNVADRSARVTAPAEGQFAYMKDTNTFAFYDGAAWTGFPTPVPAITSGTTTPSNASGANGDIYFKY